MNIISIVSGYMNPLTIGHIRYINAAAEYGKVIAIVNNDEQVRLKGSFPFMPLEERLEIVMNLKSVWQAIPAMDRDRSVSDTLLLLRRLFAEQVLIFCNGGDINEVREKEVCKANGIITLFGVGGSEKVQSSSVLISNVLAGCRV